MKTPPFVSSLAKLTSWRASARTGLATSRVDVNLESREREREKVGGRGGAMCVRGKTKRANWGPNGPKGLSEAACVYVCLCVIERERRRLTGWRATFGKTESSPARYVSLRTQI